MSAPATDPEFLAYETQYTVRAILSALGIDSPDPSRGHLDTAGPETLRLLFVPSFHPEACVTLTRRPSACEAEIRVLRTQLWRHSWPYPHRLPFAMEKASFAADAFDDIFATFQHEVVHTPPGGRGITIHDGMIIRYVYASVEKQFAFQWKTSGRNPVAMPVVRQLYFLAQDAEVKAGLGAVGGYLGDKGTSYPELLPPQPVEVIRLLILGAPEDREE